MSKRALITAAASGIGAAIALRAKSQGYEVFICDIDQARGEAFAAQSGLRFFHCDVADEEQIVTLVKTIGCVDVLVNNAGVSGPTAPVSDTSRKDWDTVFAVNVTASFVACREMVRLMQDRGSGAIVNIASVAAKIGYENRAAYAASKWAVLGLTASLAREVGTRGIRVNAVLPGTVRGERIDTVIERLAHSSQRSIADVQNQYLSRQATGRFVEPEEVAATVMFLASDEARSITGQFISVDGGFA